MFHHILVPLDGSRAAEAALPVAAYLAQKLQAKVTLLHVLEHNAPPAVHGQPHLRGAAEAQRYLAGARERFFPAGARVAVHVHAEEVRDVVEGVSAHGRELDFDLVVLCTHGRGGVRRALLGSVAQRLIGRSTAPVLAVHPDGVGPDTAFHCRSLLVPLDERVEHVRALEVSRGLAAACGAQVVLLTVVPTLASTRWRTALTGLFLPGTTARLLEMSVPVAEAALARMRERLEAAGVAAAALVLRGEPSRRIAGAADRLYADLIVMETHGKSGLEAFWQGSVASRVYLRSRAPALLVPAPR